jgi:peptidyl-prolyl cis-trans isomerase C
MYFNIGSKSFGTSYVAAALGSIAILLATASPAETIATVNGVNIESAVFDIYLESRLQKDSSEATGEERDLVLVELKDIYLLTTQPRAKEMEKDARLQAQVELQYRGMIAQAVASDYIAKHPPTDAEIFKTYTSQIEMSPTLQYRARHILVESQGEATELIKQLDDGADFEELAKASSTGPSGPAGGDLGWFAPNQMVKPFSDAVQILADGTYTKAPVQTDFGWHVIKREESRNNEPPTLDSVRDVIKQNMEQANFQKYLQQLRVAQPKTG